MGVPQVILYSFRFCDWIESSTYISIHVKPISNTQIKKQFLDLFISLHVYECFACINLSESLA